MGREGIPPLVRVKMGTVIVCQRSIRKDYRLQRPRLGRQVCFEVHQAYKQMESLIKVTCHYSSLLLLCLWDRSVCYASDVVNKLRCDLESWVFCFHAFPIPRSSFRGWWVSFTCGPFYVLISRNSSSWFCSFIVLYFRFKLIFLWYTYISGNSLRLPGNRK